MIPTASAAIAWSSIVLLESRIIGEIASSRSDLAEPAYAKESPMRAPIFKFYLF
jgi:hypothetical protein